MLDFETHRVTAGLDINILVRKLLILSKKNCPTDEGAVPHNVFYHCLLSSCYANNNFVELLPIVSSALNEPPVPANCYY